MGETVAKLRQVFDAAGQTRRVYFFDEFDAIGSQRGVANDVGEIRRALNSFLQLIEQDRSHSPVVAATNHADILDPALFRRFDDVLHYDLPDRSQIAKLLKARLGNCIAKETRWTGLAEAALGLSCADVARAAAEVVKDGLIGQRDRVEEADVLAMLVERKAISDKLNEKSAQ